MKFFLPPFLLFIFISCNSVNEKNGTGGIIRHINRPAFELQYPANWHIDSLDTDYDIDSYFSIIAPVDDGVSIFVIYNIPVDEQEQVSGQVKAHLEKIMKNGSVSYFSNWGSLKGHGAIIKGKTMGVWKGEVKIFCHSSDSCSFLNVSQYLDRDQEKVLPGFHLIESSFKLKK